MGMRRDDPTMVRERTEPGTGRERAARVRPREHIAARRTGGSNWGWAWVLAGLILLVLLAIFLIPAVVNDDPVRPVVPAAGDVEPAPGGVTLIDGTVTNILGPRTFTMSTTAFGGAEVLVVGAQAAIPSPLTIGERVQVTGDVRPFNLAAFEQEIDADLNDSAYAGWNNQTAMIARAITGVVGGPVVPGVAPQARRPGAQFGSQPGVQQGAQPAQRPADQLAPGTGAVTGQQDVTVDLILENPPAFVGQEVTVSGAIGQVLSPTAFMVEDSDFFFGDQLLIVSARGPVSVPAGGELTGDLEGREAEISGQVRTFNLTEFEDLLGTNLDDGLLRDYEGQPAIVARQVTLNPVKRGRQLNRGRRIRRVKRVIGVSRQHSSAAPSRDPLNSSQQAEC